MSEKWKKGCIFWHFKDRRGDKIFWTMEALIGISGPISGFSQTLMIMIKNNNDNYFSPNGTTIVIALCLVAKNWWKIWVFYKKYIYNGISSQNLVCPGTSNHHYQHSIFSCSLNQSYTIWKTDDSLFLWIRSYCFTHNSSLLICWIPQSIQCVTTLCSKDYFRDKY